MNQPSLLTQLFSARHDQSGQVGFDTTLLYLMLALMSLGLILVTSASMPVAERLFDNPLHFATRHAIYLIMALVVAGITLSIPMLTWQRINPFMLLCAILLLLAVLFIGHSVNGSRRWIKLGPLTLQAAEPAKLFFFCYLAGYLVRRYEQVKETMKGFYKPIMILALLSMLLLLQPDLGTTIVMFVTTVGLLFLAGAQLWQFIAIVILGLTLIVMLILTAEYRMRRLTAFLDPWADPFGSGYQLTQSLMAYGRGDWFGQGLGNSLQKLEFLPEAHTDFIMAIAAEELGFVGLVIILVLIFSLVYKAMRLGNRALKLDKAYEAYLSYAIGIWFSFQSIVNVGATAGILPTKGLTLPLISYGGSSLLIMAMATAMLMRIDYECRLDEQSDSEEQKA